MLLRSVIGMKQKQRAWSWTELTSISAGLVTGLLIGLLQLGWGQGRTEALGAGDTA